LNLQSLIQKDESLSSKLQVKDSKKPIHFISAVFAHSGDSWFWLLGLLIVYFTGGVEWKLKSAILGISVFLLAVLVMVMKFTVRRSRPAGEWGKLYRATDPHSFPSGHAARAFLLAILAVGFGPAWFAVVLIVWAPLVSLARIILAVHFLSDVLAGAIIGIAAALLILAVLPGLLPSIYPFLMDPMVLFH
jgi:undecaprenyl-diphosphatase